MKRLLFLLSVASVPLFLGACSSVPKDALVRGLKIGGTLWTPTVDAEVIATGKAAQNLSAEERTELIAPKKK